MTNDAPADVDDRELALRARGRVRTPDGDYAFEELHKRFKTRVFGVCVRKGLRDEDMYDGAQETWVKVLARIDEIADNHQVTVAAMILTIAKSAAIDFYRRRHNLGADDSRTESLADDASGGLAGPDWEHVFVCILMEKASTALSEIEREVLRLLYVEGWQHSEIARRFGVAPATITLWKQNALAKMRAALGGDFRASGVERGRQ